MGRFAGGLTVASADEHPVDLRATSARLNRAVLRFTARSPWLALGTAVAAGYVLGGGLLRPLPARLWRTGVALAIIPLVRLRLLAILETAVGAALQPQTETDRRSEMP